MNVLNKIDVFASCLLYGGPFLKFLMTIRGGDFYQNFLGAYEALVEYVPFDFLSGLFKCEM
jgi:hypothetical protein